MFRSSAGRVPSSFDQLQKRLTAAAQPLASFQVIEQRDGLARQLHQHLLAAGSTQTLTEETSFFG